MPHASVARWLAVLIVVAHVALAGWWSVSVPLGEGPDEPAHFNYALWLLREGSLPVQRADAASSDVPGEGHQPPLAYWLIQPAVRWLPPEERVLEMGSNPNFRWNGGEEPNAYFGSSRDIWPFSGVGLAWHLARGISALLGGVTVLLTYLTARRVFPDRRWLAMGAAALLAFTPQFLFAHALVSNDPLLIALTSGLLYVCVVIATAQTDRRSGFLVWSALAGTLLGLMLITKQSAIAFAPLPLLAIAIRRPSLKQLLLGSGFVVALAAAIGWWWYARNARLYGDPLGLTAFQQTFATGDWSATSWQNWSSGLWNLLRSSWGMFGWITLPFVDGAYWAFATFVALAAIGLLASIGDGWWRDRRGVALLLAAAIGLAFAWTVAFAQTAGAVAWQGRFLFPVAPALAIALALGLGIVLPGRSALWSLIGLLAILALTTPRGLIAPSYVSYALPPQSDDWGNVYGRFDVGWKRGVELRDVQVPRTAQVGSTLPVTLTWHALEQMDRPWTVFIHLVDKDGNIVSERNAEPLDGAFPANAWVRGDWIRDPKQLPLGSAPAGEYMLYIGLWDPATGDRLGTYDRDDQLFNDRVEVGPITVGARG
jgi:4-amino-4-deoxy-L-arabinose transferase-like glycosyltransferase